MDFLYQQLIAGKQKAIAGWLSAALVAFLVQQGFDLPENTAQVFEALAWGVIGLVSVYLKRNRG